LFASYYYAPDCDRKPVAVDGKMLFPLSIQLDLRRKSQLIIGKRPRKSKEIPRLALTAHISLRQPDLGADGQLCDTEDYDGINPLSGLTSLFPGDLPVLKVSNNYKRHQQSVVSQFKTSTTINLRISPLLVGSFDCYTLTPDMTLLAMHIATLNDSTDCSLSPIKLRMANTLFSPVENAPVLHFNAR
jgi:hypothetical protein